MENISDKILKIRSEYGDKALVKEDLNPDPIKQFESWLQNAIEIEASEPNAMAISTVDSQNNPRSRYVLFKNIVNDSLVFHSHYESAKAKEIENNPNVSGLFFWPEIYRQIRFEGVVSKASAEVSDEYFKSRPRGGQISAWASDQSEEIEDREILEQKIKELEKEFEGKEIPRPKFWGGYLIDIHYWEFWQGRKNRTHDRFSYSKVDTEWKTVRLSP